MLQTLLGGLAHGAIYGLIALGFVLIYKSTRHINFAQGDLLMLGAYVGLTLWEQTASWALSLWGSALLLGALGWALQRYLLRRLDASDPLAVMLFTLSLGFVLRSLAGLIWTTQPQAFPVPFAEEILVWQGLFVSGAQLSMLAGTGLMAGAVALLFLGTKLGLALRAVGQDRAMAQALGVNLRRLDALVWGLSAAFAAIAGVLLAPQSLVHPDLGWLSVKAFAAAVLFGFGNVAGAIWGGLLLGLAEQLAGRWFPALPRDVFAYLLVLGWLWGRAQAWPRATVEKLSKNRSKAEGNKTVEKLSKNCSEAELFAGAWEPSEARGRLAQHLRVLFALAALPLLLPHFWLSEATLWLTYALAGLSLRLLLRELGLVSLGHSAFVALGAYGFGIALGAGAPLPLAVLLGICASVGAGWVLAQLTSQLRGTTLTVTTLVLGLLTVEGLLLAERWTGGYDGLALELWGFWELERRGLWLFVGAVLAVFGGGVLLTRLQLSRTGRAWRASREDELAQAMGLAVNALRRQGLTLSAGFAGLAGVLLALQLEFLSPEGFPLQLSLELLLIALLAGASWWGVLWGAALVRLIPQGLALLRDFLPASSLEWAGLEALVFGALLMLVIGWQRSKSP